ncbi:alpha/beta hydrolase [Hyphomonas jannaschiana]|uniref:Esterase n=1 Tax=Hyphomonas jannaschiana VP2 TaxID=1280952 RepID=A0A059FA35_9PROT|nr:alpha/beta hydrolase-fold protein [Hyphomonas jannaschiana]KCZ87408.1 esterase [Hyphomonas jannaschiana VP2]
MVDTNTYCADIAALTGTTDNIIHLQTLDAVRAACSLPTDDVPLPEAKARLAGKQIALEASGETLTLFQLSDGQPPFTCCSLQDLNWRHLGDERTWVSRLRLKDLQSGMLMQFAAPPRPGTAEDNLLKWRGPDARPAPVPKPDLSGTLSRHELYSPQLGETRRLFVYRPNVPETGAPLPVLVLADGEELPFWARIIEPFMDSGQISPVLIVGLVSGQLGIVEDRSDLGSDIRNIDYLPSDLDGHPPSRFDAHLDFVIETVLPWAETEFGASRDRQQRVIAGMSSGGGFALNAGFRRPDIFAHAWPMSPGSDGIEAPPPAPSEDAATFRISAGYYEPRFLRSAKFSAENLSAAGYHVETHWYPAGHMQDQWELALPENLEAVFPGPASALLAHDEG